MDAILNCRVDDLEDYYNLLGCDELSTVEQILAEFKVKALECHPDKHPGNPKAVEDFQKLQQAKEILTNEESRARYDYWRRSRITIPFQQWEALSSSVKTSMHWAVQSKKDQMLEAPDLNNSNNIANEIWTQHTENSEDRLSDGNREQEDVAMSDVKLQSSRNPDSPTDTDLKFGVCLRSCSNSAKNTEVVPASREHWKCTAYLFGRRLTGISSDNLVLYMFIIMYLPFSFFLRIFRGKLLALAVPLVRGCSIRPAQEVQKL
ncbi:dnaJ homolog subfamily C member 12 isoform X1 [Columba livia]|uniref:DnaJ homolog subfamily C member 12 n=1 Tax=Columba livia TaxID=8932 RepID=A0A2I0MF40_COLLI|nr:dnaJ homolog subfamily C member 12 isoform X1 [Columba livia]PKK28286.1 DnaJ (Hsp40) homolog, subfamily C, member 12, transcript variant X1 [Columba livia]